MGKEEVYNQFQHPPNLCVLLVPRGEEWERANNAIERAALVCVAVPVETPHLTVQYLFDVDEAGRNRLVTQLEEVACHTAPLRIIVTARHTDISRFPRAAGSMILDVAKTASLCQLYSRLSEAVLAAQVLPSLMTVEDWKPHIKVFDSLSCTIDEAIDLLQNSDDRFDGDAHLIRDLSFRATTLALSHREVSGEILGNWRIIAEFPLEGEDNV